MPQATSAMQNNINFSARVVTPMQQTEQQRPQPMQQTISPPTTYTMLLNTGGAASINKQPDSGGVLLASTQAAGARTAVWNNSVSTPLSVQDTGGGLQQGSVIQIQSAVVAQQPQQQNLNQVFAKPKVRGNGNDISVSLLRSGGVSQSERSDYCIMCLIELCIAIYVWKVLISFSV